MSYFFIPLDGLSDNYTLQGLIKTLN